MPRNQTPAFTIASALASRLNETPTRTATITSPCSLILVGLTRTGSPNVTFCALDITGFGPKQLDAALSRLIHGVINAANNADKKELDIKLNSCDLHWTLPAYILGLKYTSSLRHEEFPRTAEGAYIEYDMLKLAARRGTPDFLMVDYTIPRQK